MTTTPVIGWCMQSLAIGALALACVALCPRAFRSHVRQRVPVAAFAAMLLLTAGLFTPMRPVHLTQVPQALVAVTKLDLAWVTWIWAAGSCLFLLQFLASNIPLWKLLRSTAPIEDPGWQQLLAECQQILGLRGSVRIHLAGPGFVPSAAGLFRLTVLLPDEALEWNRENRKLVLLHELGHFQRRDLWGQALGAIACALHWFNPFAWMLHRHLASEREFACDALVLARGASPDDYANLLFEMASKARRRPLQAAFLAMASAGPGKLEARVMRILEPTQANGLVTRVMDAVLCTMIAALLVACAVIKPVPETWTLQEIQTRLEAQPFP